MRAAVAVRGDSICNTNAPWYVGNKHPGISLFVAFDRQHVTVVNTHHAIRILTARDVL